MAHSPLEKIQALDAIEKEVILCLQSAGISIQCDVLKTNHQSVHPYHATHTIIVLTGQGLLELGKEKSSQKACENHTQQFLKSLNTVETKLTEQINYLTQVSTGQPHEGSGYASAKVLQMAWHRIQHARSRVRELDESRVKYQANARQQQNRANGNQPTTGTVHGML